jgi:hypothetical protein
MNLAGDSSTFTEPVRQLITALGRSISSWVAMKRLLIFALCVAAPGKVLADDDYSHVVFTGTAFMYWCTYSKVPKSIDDFAKVTDTKHRDPRITLNEEDWFKSVQFDVVGEKLKITRTLEVEQNGRVHTRRTSTSTSNCESFKPPLKQPNKPLEPMR